MKDYYALEKIKELIYELFALMHEELKIRHDIFTYKKETKGIEKVMTQDMDWSYTPADWIPNVESYYVWSDYQQTVYERLHKILELHQEKIVLTAGRIKRFI